MIPSSNLIYVLTQWSILKVTKLSLTMRDAQHLCWKTYMKFKLKEAKEANVLDVVADLKTKANSLADTIKKEAETEKIAEILSELLFAAFVLAEHSNVNEEESFLQSIDNYILRQIT